MQPLIFLSFANQTDDYLAMLKRESQNINDALKELHDKNIIEVHREESVTTDELLDALKRFRERITIFHYAGHAGGSELQFEDNDVNANGVAQLLGELPNLQLVVLNGCSTQGQVDYLLQQGVKAVIATSSPINDTKATEFASEFYSALAAYQTIETAFNFAINALKAQYGGNDLATVVQFRGFGTKPKADVFPWGLYLNKDIDKEVLEWTLPKSKKWLGLFLILLIPILLGVGIYLWYNSRPITLTVNTEYKALSPDLTFKKGVMSLTQEGKTTTDTFTNKVVFANLKKGKPVSLHFEADGFISIDTVFEVSTTELNLAIRHDNSLGRIIGTVRNDDGVAIVGATIRVKDLTTQTLADGSFMLSIPAEKQYKKQRIEVIQNGKIVWDYTQPVISSENIDIQLRTD